MKDLSREAPAQRIEAATDLDEMSKAEQALARRRVLDGERQGTLLRYVRRSLGLTVEEFQWLVGQSVPDLRRWEAEDVFPEFLAGTMAKVLEQAIDGASPKSLVLAEQAEIRRGP